LAKHGIDRSNWHLIFHRFKRLHKRSLMIKGKSSAGSSKKLSNFSWGPRA